MDQVLSHDVVRSKINSSIDEMLHKSDNGKHHAVVCFCCNRYVNRKERHLTRITTIKKKMYLFRNENNKLPPQVESYYKYTGECHQPFMDGLLMSHMLLMSIKKILGL